MPRIHRKSATRARRRNNRSERRAAGRDTGNHVRVSAVNIGVRW